MRKILLLIGLCCLFFFVGNNIVELTNPDEVFYVGTAKEMAQHNTWSVPYLFNQPHFEKPILTYWLLRIGFVFFGTDSGFGGRFFPALFALFGVLAVYGLTFLAYGNRKKATYSSIVLMSSFLYVGLARTVFTDMIFSVFILFSLAAFFWGYQRRKQKAIGIVLFWIFAALAVLTKGPLGVLVPVLVVVTFLAMRRDLSFLFCWPLLLGFLLFLGISLPWYVFIVREYGHAFIREFFYNDHIRRVLESEHRSNDKWFFYPVAMLGGFFPWTLIVSAAFVYYVRRLAKGEKLLAIQHFLLIWIVVTFSIFQEAHSKLVSYIMPIFPALAIMAGDYLEEKVRGHGRNIKRLFLVSGILLFVLPAAMVFAVFKYQQYLPSLPIVASFVVFYLSMIGLIILCVKRKKLIWSIYLLAAQALFVLCALFVSYPRIADYVTTKNAADYLMSNNKVEGRILGYKMNVRGVRFYTGHDVAFFNVKKNSFFSPHPIVDLNSDERVLAFLKVQPVTYGILDKKNWKEIERLTARYGVKAELLKVMGNQYVVKVQPATR